MNYQNATPHASLEKGMLPDSEDYGILDPEDLLPEEVFPAFKDKKTLLIPQLQSMKNYVAFHYKQPIAKRLCKWIAAYGSRQLQSESAPEAEPDTVRIERMDFWRATRYMLIADVLVSADVLVKIQGVERYISNSYIVQLVFDMCDGIECVEYGIYDKHNCPDHSEHWPLTEHMIPVLKKAEIEHHTKELLRQFNPAGAIDQKKNNPFELAKRMGLKIVRLHLYKYGKTRSILFFRAGTIAVDVYNEDGDVVGSKRVTVEAETIVINANAVHKDYCQLDVLHECVHYDWHFMFFRLQDKHCNDLRQIRKIRTIQIEKNKKKRSDPLSWLEYQATAGSFALWMPCDFMQNEINRLTAEMTSSRHQGDRFEWIGREISREYEIPKFRVRARLIRMGYIEARGCLNYLDDHYIAPFAFSRDNGSGNYTFFVTREQAANEYKSNANFRELINSGLFVYADGHVCLNDSKYILQTDKGPRLTANALARIDRCCLRFEDIYEQDEAYAFRYGRLNSDEAYNNHYLYFPPTKYTARKPQPSVEQQRELNAKYIATLPHSVPEMLTKLMKDCKVSVEELASRTTLAERTITRLRNTYYPTYTIDTILALIIGLHLPPWVSINLLNSASCNFMTNPACFDYAYIVNCLFMDNLETVQEHLVRQGMKKLQLRSSEEATA